VHSDGVRVASAQSNYMKTAAHIRLWNSDNLHTLSVFKDTKATSLNYTHLTFYLPEVRFVSLIDSTSRKTGHTLN